MLISDLVISIVATIVVTAILFASEDDIEAWAEKQRKHYR